MMKKLIFFFGILLITSSAVGQDITGTWYGILNVMGQQLNLVLHIQKTDAGYQTKMDSPDQHAKGISVTKTTFKADSLILDLVNLHATYKGKYNKAQHQFKGTFTQRGQAFPLQFSQKKVAKTKPKRPQEPKKPYPYYSENVTIKNKKDKVTLAGTLTLPKKTGNFPAVVLISGSGPQNRNEEVMDHKPFLVISDYLTRHGIAVLRYDDRGVGKSTGDYSRSSMQDFADDAEAVFNYLRKRKEIDKHAIGLVGHSEGGAIAPIIAARNKQVAFIVLLAGLGIPGDEVILKQGELIAIADGMSADKAAKIRQINKKAFEMLKNNVKEDSLQPQLTRYYKQTLIDYPNLMKPKGVNGDLFVKQLVHQLTSNEFKSILLFNPKPILEKVNCPVLALGGSHDLQVPPKEDLAGIKKAVIAGGNKNVTTIEIPGLNHLFQACKTGSPSEYAKIEQTFSPKALKILKDWILKETQSM